MTRKPPAPKKIPLDRLREISKPRAIRRPQLPQEREAEIREVRRAE